MVEDRRLRPGAQLTTSILAGCWLTGVVVDMSDEASVQTAAAGADRPLYSYLAADDDDDDEELSADYWRRRRAPATTAAAARQCSLLS